MLSTTDSAVLWRFSALCLILCACASVPKRELQASPVEPRAELRADLVPAKAMNGSIVLLNVQAPPRIVQESISAEFEGIRLPLFTMKDDVYQAILGVPFQRKPGLASVTLRWKDGDDVKTQELPLMIEEGDYRAETLSVDPRYSNPREKDLIRIRREIAEVKEIYNRVTPRKYWKGPFVLPVRSAITSPFGTKRVFNGEMQSFHQGLDLKAKVGTPIRSAAPGKIVMSKNLFFTGKTIIIDHGYGVFTLYAHLSKTSVKKGQTVKGGQLLGLAGSTGRVSGPHLHWGAIIHKMKVNPLDLTRVMQ